MNTHPIPKEARGCCEKCKVQDGAFCAYSKCPCHFSPVAAMEPVQQQHDASKEAIEENLRRSSHIPYRPTSSVEHSCENNIESNMCAPHCRVCGKEVPSSVEEVIEEYTLKCLRFRSEGGFITDRGFEPRLVIPWLRTKLTPTEPVDVEGIRTFEMIREGDESGVSGTGKVLEGTVFTDGTTVVRWTVEGKPQSTAVYPSFDDFHLIHVASHPTNGTSFRWTTPTTPSAVEHPTNTSDET